MTKKGIQSFCHWVSEIRLVSWFNISPKNLSQIGTLLVDEQEGVRLRGFNSVFDRLAKASTFVLNANFLPSSSQRFPARCRRPPCCSSP